MLGEIEQAEAIYELKTARIYDEKVIAAATGEFNGVLKKAADAIVQDLNDGNADKFLDEWRPRSPTDTWFGPQPGRFIHHLLSSGSVYFGFQGKF